MNSKYIAFKETNAWKMYSLQDGGAYYMREGGKGFSVKDVVNYPHNFLFGELEEDLLNQIKAIEYKKHHGDGKAGDFQCPSCGFWHTFYSDYEGPYEGYKDSRACLCGLQIKAEIAEVKVIWNYSTH